MGHPECVRDADKLFLDALDLSRTDLRYRDAGCADGMASDAEGAEPDLRLGGVGDHGPVAGRVCRPARLVRPVPGGGGRRAAPAGRTACLRTVTTTAGVRAGFGAG